MVRGVGAVILASLALGACSASSEDASEGQDSAVNAADKAGPGRFRQDFAWYLKNEGKYSDEDIQKLVYLPTDAVMKPRVDAPDPSAPLAKLDEAFKRVRPSDLYENGVKANMKLPKDVSAALRSNPVHIVVVPGIFGEFIDVSPFQEIFDAKSSARAAWEKLTKEKKDDPNAKDDQYSIVAMKDVTKPLSEMLKVGSIDDENGNPLVTVTYLTPVRGSFEDFGTLDEDNAYYLRRLKKYFALIGEPENLYILGYSRGTATGLDLVAEAAAKPNDNPWIKGLDGFISHAGVIYGTQLADNALDPSSPTKKSLEVIQQLAEDLTECGDDDGVLASGATIVANKAKFDLAAAKIGYYQLQAPKHPELDFESLDSAAPNYASILSFAKGLFFDDLLHMGSPVAECKQNVQRFRVMVKKMVDGAETLTTKSRLDWWRTHTLPTHVRYYAITGTMGDATHEQGKLWSGGFNPLAYDTRSVDFRSLRGNYYDLLAASGNEANDSQVPVQRGKFWPELTPVLNPNQGQLKTYFMGTLGIHHWGLAFPRAFASNDGLTANPFPRTLLVKAMATFVAQVAAENR